MWTLWLALALGSGISVADTATADGDEAALELADEAPDDGAATEADAPAPGLLERRDRPRSERRPPVKQPQTKSQVPKLLAILALLLLWLLTRKQNERQGYTAPVRRQPLNEEELGRAVFEAAMNDDLEAYRGLFLNGGEAARLHGVQGAETYLAQRNLKMLEDALVDLAVRLPDRSIYTGASVIGDGSKLAIKAKTPAGSEVMVSVGTFAKVGAVYRLEQADRVA